MLIKDIAQVVAGYAFRGAITPDTNGGIFVFQAKDLIQGEPFVNTSTLAKVSLDIPEHLAYLQKNDILLIARGMKSGAFRSTVFVSDEPNVIASSSVHIIRVKNKEMLPEYISHYLNSKEGQDSLSQIVSGSYIGAIPRGELEKIQIPIPQLQKQKAIIDLFQNMRVQHKILFRKNELKQNIINATFKRLTTK